ncbi:M1 family metallopeptidase [Flavobacterium sp.]|uniref:M1 family metallopeptidase n=1 Tax=Flavobacterium sp. TaxID=239 RepID=UPI00263090A7|nr:M1 family metallopeptidase [Flavobacterium sp.]
MKPLLIFGTFFCSLLCQAQNGYWQQHVDYKMEVSMDVTTYRYTGTQELTYTNNSPDTLQTVYYHLYNNAFQPGSEMDMRIQHIKDPDSRMVNKIKEGDKEIKQSRIAQLKPDEIGYLNVSNVRQAGALLETTMSGTLLKVPLAAPLLPGKSTMLTLNFEGQVPLQIRRSGRNNREGVALSMSQWYPKMAEFDFEGWHVDPYIAREFQGVWGNFDVKITIDKSYILGGTGYLQNGNEIGYNYQDSGVKVTIPKKQKTLTWHFVAPQVHDFTWAADPDYVHDIAKGPNGVALHFLYKNKPEIALTWKAVQPKVVTIMDLFNYWVGPYPYKQYSVIQGGDGGMEYAMCTLILGEGELNGLTGLIAHEMGHSWFQHILATNESKHPWMDEGFTSYIEDRAMNTLSPQPVANPYAGAYKAYINLANSGKEQPLSTHADRYDENRSYSIASYSKGEVFLAQLEYLLGRVNLDKILRRYYQDFKFKHPTPNDIKRTAERVSGAVLDWYLIDFTQTTNTIDYSIASVEEKEGAAVVNLERLGRMPMPIDLQVTYTDGSKENFYIPLRMLHYIKPNPDPELPRKILTDWTWGNPRYQFRIEKPLATIKSIVIDPMGLMADVKGNNNQYEN